MTASSSTVRSSTWLTTSETIEGPSGPSNLFLLYYLSDIPTARYFMSQGAGRCAQQELHTGLSRTYYTLERDTHIARAYWTTFSEPSFPCVVSAGDGSVKYLDRIPRIGRGKTFLQGAVCPRHGVCDHSSPRLPFGTAPTKGPWYSGRAAVSKTAYGGSTPSGPTQNRRAGSPYSPTLGAGSRSPHLTQDREDVEE